MGMFDGIENAATNNSGGTNLTAGHYIMRVDRIKAGESQQGKGGFMAVEMTVLAVLPGGDVPLDENFQPLGREAWHHVGQSVSDVMMSHWPSFKGNVKAMVANIGGIDPKDVTQERCEQVTNGLFDGLFIELRAKTIKTKNSGKPFTKVSYLREVEPADLKARVSAEDLDSVLGEGKIDELIEAYEAA